MTQNELREYFVDIDMGNIMLFEDPSYDEACIGFTNDGRACYSYDKMIEWLMENWDMTMEEAVDHINYDTERSICPDHEHSPIIINDLPELKCIVNTTEET